MLSHPLLRRSSLPLLLLTGLLAACNPGTPGTPVSPPDEGPPVNNIAAINFQPTDSTPSGGFTADTGAEFSAARGYGWVTEASAGTASATPLDLRLNTRDRKTDITPAQLNSFIHMQYSGSTGNTTAGAWEYTLPNGIYTVTVTVGDAANNFDSSDTINIEGKVATSAFVPTAVRHFYTGTLRVPVTDGKLTIDAKGGTNTKINAVVIAPGDRPSVRKTNIQDAESMVSPSSALSADLNVIDSGISLASLNSATVKLTEHATGIQVEAKVNSSGGNDVVNLTPTAQLKPFTRYDFSINAALRDEKGLAFQPVTRTFTTGPATVNGSGIAFEQVALPSAPPLPYTSVEIGPDHKLYAATFTGSIVRFNILSDGTLGPAQKIDSVVQANGGPRTIIGLRFDPASTADNLILWITNNAFWDGQSEAPDWSGKITRLSGPDLATVQDAVVNLPRSTKDHMTNALAFKPREDTVLYITQGANNAMGAPDPTWGNRPEHLLSAAVLRLDLNKLNIAAGPLNAKTESGGTYNPYAANAPLTVYASGVRNAYRLIWASNGSLYAPANGSAAGGNTPAAPANAASLPECKNRPEGTYAGPAAPALFSASVESDYLFRILQGGYYGHPNPTRCEWVMNGGNPTAGADRAQVVDYPVGVQPDPNYRGYAYDFGEHTSPNGAIEEYSSKSNPALKNKLMIARYASKKDIIILTPGANGDIDTSQSLENVTGLTKFKSNPLDITEDRDTGNLYVAELDQSTYESRITLVRPK
jgi:Bacterial Ig-like domain